MASLIDKLHVMMANIPRPTAGGVLLALAVVCALFTLLELIMYKYETGVFHLLTGCDIAYDGGAGFGSIIPKLKIPGDKNSVECIPDSGSERCGGNGFNAAAISFMLAVAFLASSYAAEDARKNAVKN